MLWGDVDHTKSRNTASIACCYNSVKQKCFISMKHRVTIVLINSFYFYGTRVTIVLRNSVVLVLSDSVSLVLISIYWFQ